MSDLVRLLRALSRYEHSDASLGDEAADELERLTAELASARQDAQRWRWFRRWWGNDKPPPFGLMSSVGASGLDAAIDAAIGEKA